MLPSKNSVQPKEQRIRNFQEACPGFSKRAALEEARRCPQCSEPACRTACPLGIDIPAFVRSLREGDAGAALQRIHEDNALPGVCGRLCPAPCEAKCILNKDGRPLAIRRLERYVADHGQKMFPFRREKKSDGEKVAVVGAGTAGLSAAACLAARGRQVTVFEMLPLPGGVLLTGVPEFRFPKSVLAREVDFVKSLGVVVQLQTGVGQGRSLNSLFADGFSAAVLAVGNGGAQFTALPGSFWAGVCYAEEFLFRLNFSGKGNGVLPPGENVVVLGQGNPALDCARACVRLGKTVSVVFERTREEMAAYHDDVAAAQEEGVRLEGLTRPLEMVGDQDGNVCGVKCQSLDFADPKSTGRWELLPVPGSEFVAPADAVILAGGQKANEAVGFLWPDLKRNAEGTIWADADTGMTSLAGVFCAGDAATGPGSVVSAVASGKQVAGQVCRYLEKEH